MGLLIDFYTGDAEKIINAWRRGDSDMLAQRDIVYSRVDLSFHLSPEDLDQLMLAGCALLGRPPMIFERAIQEDILLVPVADPEKGIHQMTDAFANLFADIQPDQVATLYEMWTAQMPDPEPSPCPSASQRFSWELRKYLLDALFWLLLAPVLATYWLLSPSFRKERRQNKAEREAAKNKPTAVPKYALNDAVADLITTCKTAKERGTKVLYAWSL